MTTVKELVHSGKLAAAVEELNRQVRSEPANLDLRVALFELLCFQGQYDRAQKQLDVIGTQRNDLRLQFGVQFFRNCLEVERKRQAFFEGQGLPAFLTEPPQYVEDYLILNRQLTSDPQQVPDLAVTAEASRPEISGQLNGEKFASFRDSDDRLAGVLEVYDGAEYLWLPTEQIRSVQVSKPEKLRDLLWISAEIQVVDESPRPCFLPVLYPGTAKATDEELRLGRRTDWAILHDQLVIGTGQKVFLVDDQEVSLLELGRIEFQSVGVQV